MHKPSFEAFVMSHNPYQHLNSLGSYDFTTPNFQIGSEPTSNLTFNAGLTPLNLRHSEAASAACIDQQNVNDSFPCKLHQMLSDIEAQGMDHVVSWQPHGRRRKDFVDHIMPSYFRMSKFASFQRQLNLYGFNRFTAGRDKGGYYHDLFLRGQPELCFDILRRKVKGTGARKPATPESEPNFYRMPYMPPSNAKKSAVAASQMSSAGLSSMMDSSTFVLPQHQLASAPTSSSIAQTQGDSLVSMAALAPREMFANMLDPAVHLSRRPSAAEDYQLHSQQQQVLDRRLSLLSGQFNVDRRFSLFSNPYDQFSANPVEPIQISHHHHQQQQQQQQLQLQLLQRQQLLSQPLLPEETDRNFDAAIAALMRMDPPNL